MNISIVNLADFDSKFVINIKKDGAMGVITTYISRYIRVHTSEIECPHSVWTKLKTMLNKINGEVMHIEKYLISLEPLSFDHIEDYLTRIKELQLKLGECHKDNLKNDEHLIMLVLMNLKTPYDVFCSSF